MKTTFFDASLSYSVKPAILVGFTALLASCVITRPSGPSYTPQPTPVNINYYGYPSSNNPNFSYPPDNDASYYYNYYGTDNNNVPVPPPVNNTTSPNVPPTYQDFDNSYMPVDYYFDY